MLLNGTVQDDQSNFNKWNIYVSSDLKFQMKKEKLEQLQRDDFKKREEYLNKTKDKK